MAQLSQETELYAVPSSPSGRGRADKRIGATHWIVYNMLCVLGMFLNLF